MLKPISNQMHSNTKYIILFPTLFLLFYFFDLTFGYSHRNSPQKQIVTTSPSAQFELTNQLSNIDCYSRMDVIIEKFASKWALTGVSVAVAYNNNLVYAKGFGHADKENNELTQPYHLFRIASASKLITAVAVMKLVEEGKLTLESQVFGQDGILNDISFNSYIDKRVEQINVKQLLNHSAGWTTRWGDHLFMNESIARQMEKELPLQKDDIIQFALSKRLHFNPGTSSSYNNLGYIVLERVIEKVSGKSYESFVKEAVFTPIGVNDAFIAFNYDSLRYPYEVRYYEVDDAEPIPAFDGSQQLVMKSRGGNDIRTLGAAGGWVISSVSLIKLLLAIDPENSSEAIISKKSSKKLIQREPGFQPMGWRTVTASGNKWRTGSFAGSSTLALQRTDGFTFVFLSNTSSWRGSKFPYEVDRMMSRAIQSVESWPDINLLNPNGLKFPSSFPYFHQNFGPYADVKFSGTLKDFILNPESI